MFFKIYVILIIHLNGVLSFAGMDRRMLIRVRVWVSPFTPFGDSTWLINTVSTESGNTLGAAKRDRAL